MKLLLASFVFTFAIAAHAQTGNVQPPTTTTIPPLTDAQIASVLQTANKAEIEAGQLAAKKAQNAEVKKFAQDMVAAHKKASVEGDKAAKSAKVKAQDAPLAQDMKTTAEQTKSTLEQLNGIEFDKAYVNSQVSMHTDVLKTIDTQLLPSAKSAQMKGLLQKLRRDIEAHLKHAEALKAKLM